MAEEKDDLPDFIGDTLVDLPLFSFGKVGALQSGAFGGVVERVGDRDLLAAELIAGVTYKFLSRGLDSLTGTLPDPFLRLLDSAGTPLASDNDNGDGRDSELLFTPITTGKYYLEASDASGGTGNYTAQVNGLDLFEGAAETTFRFMTNGPLDSSAILSQFAQTQFTHGQQIGVASPTVYMYEALGLALAESTPALQGSLSPGNAPDRDFVDIIYETVFGIQPNAAQVQVFLSQLDFFKSIYVASGAFGSDITHIQTLARGAVTGQMLGVNEVIAINNASTTTANLLGTSATMDFDLL
jgi:hypothetical protein